MSTAANTPEPQPGPQPPVEPGAGNPFRDFAMKMGLGPHWQPGPMSWSILPGQMNGQPAVFVMLARGQGLDCLAMTHDDWRKLIDQVTQAMSGLTIARDMPPPNGKPA